MSSEPSDSNSGNNEDNGQGFVQDYLDLLLATKPGVVDTETATPQTLKPIIIPRLERRLSDIMPSLMMVAGTDMKSTVAGTDKKSVVATNMSSQAQPDTSTVRDSIGVMTVERRRRLPRIKGTKGQLILPVTQWLNDRPLWAQDRFECLLFRVSGLTLAIPLVELAGIYPMTIKSLGVKDERLSSMGLLSVKNRRISVIDTASVVMSDRYDPSMQERFNYVVAIKGMDWGLAVDHIDGAQLQEVNGVRWRSELTTRRWLAGMVIDHACAIFEVNELNSLFQQYPSD